LESTSPQDINVITIANEALQRLQANRDPLEDSKIYGTIYNPYVKRRKNHPATAAAKPALSSQSLASAVKSVLEQPAAARPAKQAASTPSSSGKPAAKSSAKPQPAAKPGGSALFNSFAKTRPPKPAAAKQPAPAQKKADADGKQSSGQSHAHETRH
jgi:hypothetical protein